MDKEILINGEGTKTKLSLSAIDVLSYEPVLATESKPRGHNYIKWGLYNEYPEYLYDVYSNCATLQSILNGSAKFTLGDGIISNIPYPKRNSKGETLYLTISKLTLDKWIFGGFALLVKYNTLGIVTEVSYIDFRRCRTNIDASIVYVNSKWDKWGSNRYDKFNGFNPKKGAQDGVQIYYYKGNKTRDTYPIPDYSAALVSAHLLINILKFHYNELNNNFVTSGILNYNKGVPSDEELNIIEASFIDKFTGKDNAGRMIISFNEDKEMGITYDRLGTDDFPDRYNALATSSRENLFISMLALPILFAVLDTTGFNKLEYRDAFALYYKTSVSPVQDEIIDVFDIIFDGLFTTEHSIEFKSFNINFSE